jgi:hypothetical protein
MKPCSVPGFMIETGALTGRTAAKLSICFLGMIANEI